MRTEPGCDVTDGAAAARGEGGGAQEGAPRKAQGRLRGARRTARSGRSGLHRRLRGAGSAGTEGRCTAGAWLTAGGAASSAFLVGVAVAILFRCQDRSRLAEGAVTAHGWGRGAQSRVHGALRPLVTPDLLRVKGRPASMRPYPKVYVLPSPGHLWVLTMV